MARLTYSGTHRGELFDIAPTGKRVTYAGVAIFRIADACIAEGWVLGDAHGLIQQLRERHSVATTGNSMKLASPGVW